MKLLKDDFVIHDKYRFELKFNYNLFADKDISKYTIDAYFFIPSSLDINENTYSKELFYNNMQNYIRFKTPDFRLDNIINGDDTPFYRLKNSIAKINTSLNKNSFHKYVYYLKMFSSIVRSSVKHNIEKIKKADKKKINEKKYIDEYLKYIPIISEEFKKLEYIIPQNNKYKTGKIYLVTDEYLSLLIETFTFDLIKVLEKKGILTLKVRNSLIKIIKNEIKSRKIKGYESIVSKKGNNEVFLYRLSRLKKIMSSALFIEVLRIKGTKKIEQFWFGIAAGVAMTFSTIVTLIARWKYGGFTTSFFFVVIFAYIFKDRIKDFMRFYFKKTFMNSMPDNIIKLFGPLKKIRIGVLKESFTFIDEKKIDNTVMTIRDREDIFDFGENIYMPEYIFLYRKNVVLFSKRLRNIFNKINAIHDIMRFNVNDFLLKMDDPTKVVYFLNGNKIEALSASRVYHINIVLKLTTPDDIVFKKFRVILNRKGIKKIKRVY